MTRQLTIKLEGATILQDGFVAPSDDGREVFVFPANLGAKQVDVHPDNKMIVVAVPASEFEPLAQKLLTQGRVTFGSPSPRKGIGSGAPQGIDYEIEEGHAAKK